MKITAIGGGTGLSTLLRGLKLYSSDLTAVVTITDEGGSSGILREELNVPPPGDVRNNLVALASDEDILGKLFNYRFKNGSLNGHTVGNIILAALTKLTGSFPEAVAKAADILAIKGRVLPVSDKMARLVAVFEDGQTVAGETKIVDYGKKSMRKIVELKLETPIQINPSCYDAIVQSDVLVFGPGSLYTSIIANLIVDGFKEAVKKSKAIKIYIANIMTQPGETFGYKLNDHVLEIEKYLEQKLDFVIYSFPPSQAEVLEKYKIRNSVPVELDINDHRVIAGHFSKIILENEPRIRHDSFLIAKALFEISKKVLTNEV